MPTRPILLLDVMDTLVVEPFWTVVPAFFGVDLATLRSWQHPTAWIAFEEGRLTEEAYLRRFFRDGRPFDQEGLRRAIWDAYAWIDGTEELLAELAGAGLSLHALSNYPVWYRQLDERLGLSRYLRFSFVSCRTGVRKPDPRAWLGALEHLETGPEGCLFVDDRPANVEAARRLGIPSVPFEGAAALRTELVGRGVLPG